MTLQETAIKVLAQREERLYRMAERTNAVRFGRLQPWHIVRAIQVLKGEA